jgi:tetratricopeptide (TPR) repeat protein
MKRQWAEKELAALDAIPQYSYIIEAQLAGPELKATEEIPEADDLYYQALVIEEDAKKLILLKNKEKLRIALDKYNRLIRDYPTSDKIDDAAYRAGRIYEGFKDYSIALLYYQRAYQWNPDTSYPARYRSADVLDKHMHRRSEALDLYQEALEKDKLTSGQREAAQERIDDYTKSGEKTD